MAFSMPTSPVDYPDPDSVDFPDQIGPWAASLGTMTTEMQTLVSELNSATALVVPGEDVNIDSYTFYVDVSANKVGFGTNAPDGRAHVYTADAGAITPSTSADELLLENSGNAGMSILTPNSSTASIYFADPDDNDAGGISYSHSSDAMTIRANGATRLTCSPSGVFYPGADNAQTLGSASFRWSVVYAGTGTINTSDATLKQDVVELGDAERRVALAAKGLLRKYRWRDAVAAKGDLARWHFGVVAQDLAAAFEAEGLDPWAYGILCRDEWWTGEVLVPAQVDKREIIKTIKDAVGRETRHITPKHVQTEPARWEAREYQSEAAAPIDARNLVRSERWGVRYDELLAFILAAL